MKLVAKFRGSFQVSCRKPQLRVTEAVIASARARRLLEGCVAKQMSTAIHRGCMQKEENVRDSIIVSSSYCENSGLKLESLYSTLFVLCTKPAGYFSQVLRRN